MPLNHQDFVQAATEGDLDALDDMLQAAFEEAHEDDASDSGHSYDPDAPLDLVRWRNQLDIVRAGLRAATNPEVRQYLQEELRHQQGKVVREINAININSVLFLQHEEMTAAEIKDARDALKMPVRELVFAAFDEELKLGQFDEIIECLNRVEYPEREMSPMSMRTLTALITSPAHTQRASLAAALWPQDAGNNYELQEAVNWISSGLKHPLQNALDQLVLKMIQGHDNNVSAVIDSETFSGEFVLTRFLAKHGAVPAQKENQNKLLTLAIRRKNRPVAELLVASGHQVTRENLRDAVRTNDEALVSFVINQCTFEPGAVNSIDAAYLAELMLYALDESVSVTAASIKCQLLECALQNESGAQAIAGNDQIMKRLMNEKNCLEMLIEAERCGAGGLHDFLWGQMPAAGKDAMTAALEDGGYATLVNKLLGLGENRGGLTADGEPLGLARTRSGSLEVQRRELDARGGVLPPGQTANSMGQGPARAAPPKSNQTAQQLR